MSLFVLAVSCPTLSRRKQELCLSPSECRVCRWLCWVLAVTEAEPALEESPEDGARACKMWSGFHRDSSGNFQIQRLQGPEFLFRVGFRYNHFVQGSTVDLDLKAQCVPEGWWQLRPLTGGSGSSSWADLITF